MNKLERGGKATAKGFFTSGGLLVVGGIVLFVVFVIFVVIISVKGGGKDTIPQETIPQQSVPSTATAASTATPSSTPNLQTDIAAIIAAANKPKLPAPTAGVTGATKPSTPAASTAVSPADAVEDCTKINEVWCYSQEGNYCSTIGARCRSKFTGDVLECKNESVEDATGKTIITPVWVKAANQRLCVSSKTGMRVLPFVSKNEDDEFVCPNHVSGSKCENIGTNIEDEKFTIGNWCKRSEKETLVCNAQGTMSKLGTKGNSGISCTSDLEGETIVDGYKCTAYYPNPKNQDVVKYSWVNEKKVKEEIVAVDKTLTTDDTFQGQPDARCVFIDASKKPQRDQPELPGDSDSWVMYKSEFDGSGSKYCYYLGTENVALNPAASSTKNTCCNTSTARKPPGGSSKVCAVDLTKTGSSLKQWLSTCQKIVDTDAAKKEQDALNIQTKKAAFAAILNDRTAVTYDRTSMNCNVGYSDDPSRKNPDPTDTSLPTYAGVRCYSSEVGHRCYNLDDGKNVYACKLAMPSTLNRYQWTLDTDQTTKITPVTTTQQPSVTPSMLTPANLIPDSVNEDELTNGTVTCNIPGKYGYYISNEPKYGDPNLFTCDSKNLKWRKFDIDTDPCYNTTNPLFFGNYMCKNKTWDKKRNRCPTKGACGTDKMLCVSDDNTTKICLNGTLVGDDVEGKSCSGIEKGTEVSNFTCSASGSGTTARSIWTSLQCPSAINGQSCAPTQRGCNASGRPMYCKLQGGAGVWKPLNNGDSCLNNGDEFKSGTRTYKCVNDQWFSNEVLEEEKLNATLLTCPAGINDAIRYNVCASKTGAQDSTIDAMYKSCLDKKGQYFWDPVKKGHLCKLESQSMASTEAAKEICPKDFQDSMRYGVCKGGWVEKDQGVSCTDKNGQFIKTYAKYGLDSGWLCVLPGQKLNPEPPKNQAELDAVRLLETYKNFCGTDKGWDKLYKHNNQIWGCEVTSNDFQKVKTLKNACESNVRLNSMRCAVTPDPECPYTVETGMPLGGRFLSKDFTTKINEKISTSV